jgi:hypothetical protein
VTPDRPLSNGHPRIRAGGFREISSLIVACCLFNRQRTSGDAIGNARVDHIRNLIVVSTAITAQSTPATVS